MGRTCSTIRASQPAIATYDELDVYLVDPGQQEEFDDGRVEDLVVVRLAAEPHELWEHVDIEATSVGEKQANPVSIVA